jgi:uncharacterized membrane protein YeiH
MLWKKAMVNLIDILDLIGTAAFAASGAWVGVRKHMDLFGVMVLGTVTAVGGGTLRDLFLGDIPPFSLDQETYIYLALAVSFLVFTQRNRFKAFEKPLLYFDAIGLGTFVVIGTTKAIDFKLGGLGSVLMGVMTGTAGGVMRDLLANQVPLILRSEIYASACVVGATLLVIFDTLHLDSSLGVFISAVTVITLRILAIHFHWSLPKS